MESSSRNSTVDEILSRCNIVDVIGSVVGLKKSGANYVGLCPFHNEKTPSFVVSESKQIFTCFGCHQSGNVISFVMKYYNLSFLEAIEKLADQYGIEIRKGRYDSGKKEQLYNVNTQAARFFYRAMRKDRNPAWDYMIGRGLEKETLHDFGIGYADDQWDSLYRHLKSLGFSEDIMMKAGLISQSKGKYFDKFRNRVIFPIQNTAGKVIGFGGRAIGDQMPKYLNSQETPVFQKKNNIYALNITKNHVTSEDRIILVEGYMDVISLYQYGIKNVGASLGTALTENQARLIKRFTKNVILSYDSDSAGISAAVRGGKILHEENLKVRIMHVTDGKDPDEFIRIRGKLAFRELVDKSSSYGDYMISSIASGYNMKTTEGRVDFLKEVSDFLRSLSPVEAEVYMEKVTERYGISKGALRNEINMDRADKGYIRDKDNEKNVGNASEAAISGKGDITKIEQNIIKILIVEPSYFDKMKEYRKIFTSISGSLIFSAMENVYGSSGDMVMNQVYEQLGPQEAENLKYIENNISLGGNIETVFKECIRSFDEEWLAKREKEIIEQLNIADEKNSIEEIEKLTEELMVIQKKKLGRG